MFQNIQPILFAWQTQIGNYCLKVVSSNQIYRGFTRICLTNLMASTLQKRDYVSARQGFVLYHEYIARHKFSVFYSEILGRSKYFLARTGKLLAHW
jgi:hypothetical protein